MKTRTCPFFLGLAITGAATILAIAQSEPGKPNGDSGAGGAASEATGTDAGKPPASPRAKLSFGVDDVVKMVQGGVEADVILNYIENSRVPYHLNAEDIISLHDLGVPSSVTAEMIRHGAKVQNEAALAYQQTQQRVTEEAKAASAYANTYSTPVYTAPQPPVVNYNYAYPDYGYSGYPVYAYSGFYSYPSYSYVSPFYFRVGIPFGFHHFQGFHSGPRFGFGAGFGHSTGFRVGGGFHTRGHR